MLVLSRRQGESILIDSGIEVVVLSSRGGSVRLGFNAPGHVAIHRAEVQQRIAEEASHEHIDRHRVEDVDQVVDRR